MRHLAVIAAFAAVISLPWSSSAAAAEILVLAAASLTEPLGKIARSYAESRDVNVRTSFAASSTLAKQIVRGAPADIYVSANPQWMAYVKERDAVEPASEARLTGNSLVVIVPARSSAISLPSPSDLSALVGNRRLALADPDHVPAGIYAKAALESYGTWETLRQRLARTVDVRAGLALVERDEVPAGIVYGTDAAGNKRVRVVYRFPACSHPDIAYVAAILKGRSRPEVMAFFAHMFSSAANEVFAADGFAVD